MPYTLKNKTLELSIDDPLENYQFSRFDWSGKLIQLKFKGIELCTTEFSDQRNLHDSGRGLYNEFGMNSALGFGETDMGGWFHKIGIGLLKKDSDNYNFLKPYEIQPAEFTVLHTPRQLEIKCTSDEMLGYAYSLKKSFSLHDFGFIIHYCLENRGERVIQTEEYNHNFLGFEKCWVDSNYELKFPFELLINQFKENINPENKVDIKGRRINWSGEPKDPFFFDHLNGELRVSSSWELINNQLKLGIREIGSFETTKVNLWGWQHVISPELFHRIKVDPQEKIHWTRRYEVFEI